MQMHIVTGDMTNVFERLMARMAIGPQEELVVRMQDRGTPCRALLLDSFTKTIEEVMLPRKAYQVDGSLEHCIVRDEVKGCVGSEEVCCITVVWGPQRRQLRLFAAEFDEAQPVWPGVDLHDGRVLTGRVLVVDERRYCNGIAHMGLEDADVELAKAMTTFISKEDASERTAVAAAAMEEAGSMFGVPVVVLEATVDGGTRCAACNKVADGNTPRMRRCGGCQAVWSCDQACQRAHWVLGEGGHKGVCRGANKR